MKFGRKIATLAAAAALLLGAGATASSAAVGDGFEVSDVTFTHSPVSGLGVKDFNLEPTADGFNLTTTFAVAAKGPFNVALGIYTDDFAATYDTTTYTQHGPGIAKDLFDVSEAMTRMSEELSRGGHWGPPSRFSTPVKFAPSGNYTVILFDLSAGQPEFLAGARVGMTVVTPDEPAFDSVTGILEIPQSDHFDYVDGAGNLLLPGSVTVTDRLTVKAEPNLAPGYIAAAGAWEWNYVVVPAVPVPPVTPPAPPTPPGPVAPSESSPSEDRLTAALEGKVSAPTAAVPGEKVQIFVGTEYAGQEVDVYVFSDPVFLGRHLVAADGTVTVTLPNGLTGAHRLAVYNGGDLIGWNRILIDDVIGNGFVAGSVTDPVLARTGSGSLDSAWYLAIGCLIAGAAGLLVRRRALSRGL